MDGVELDIDMVTPNLKYEAAVAMVAVSLTVSCSAKWRDMGEASRSSPTPWDTPFHDRANGNGTATLYPKVQYVHDPLSWNREKLDTDYSILFPEEEEPSELEGLSREEIEWQTRDLDFDME